MYIEKRRHELKDIANHITLAIDELPDPLGWFAEIELPSADSFQSWEQLLTLEAAEVEDQDYGQLIKHIDTSAAQAHQRWLAFTQQA